MHAKGDQVRARQELALAVRTSEQTIRQVLNGHVPRGPLRLLIAQTIGSTEDEVFPFIHRGEDAA